MSKKRKRRLRKLAKVLGAGLAIAGLGKAFANRNKASAADVDSGRGGDSASAMARKIAMNTPEENTFKVQDVVVEVPEKKSIVRNVPRTTNLGKMEGAGPESGLIGQKKRSDYVQRAKDAAAANAMRAFRSNEAYRGNMMTTPDSILQGIPESALMAKKGGRIVKGKKTAVRTGAAKRGFGRAFKGGKR
jgi:hypothetical protein